MKPSYFIINNFKLKDLTLFDTLIIIESAVPAVHSIGKAYRPPPPIYFILKYKDLYNGGGRVYTLYLLMVDYGGIYKE